MGIESGLMSNNMVTVSSSTIEGFNAMDLSLDKERGWVPFTASANQWIQVSRIRLIIITIIAMHSLVPSKQLFYSHRWTLRDREL